MKKIFKQNQTLDIFWAVAVSACVCQPGPGELVWNDAAKFATNHRSETDHSSRACGEPGEGYPAPSPAPALWLAGRGESWAVIGCWRVISVHCQIMMDHCPTHSSLPAPWDRLVCDLPPLSLSRCPRPVQQTLCQKIPTQDEKRECSFQSYTL